MFERISPTAERIIAAVARYQYLTAAQLQRLGVTADKSHLYDTLRQLKRGRGSPLVEIPFGIAEGRRQASLYALKPSGRDIAVELIDPDLVRFHPRIRIFTNDYFHKVACVDFAITVHQWAEANGYIVEPFHTYYDPFIQNRAGRRLRKQTTIDLAGRVLEPDGIFALTGSDQVQRFFVYEYYRGDRTGRVFKQLESYLTAIADNCFQKAYGFKSAVRILVTFDNERQLDLSCQRLRIHQGFSERHKWFFLAPQRTVVVNDFFGSWQRLDGEVVKLF